MRFAAPLDFCHEYSVTRAHISTRDITHEDEGRSVIRGIDQSEVISVVRVSDF